MGKVITFSAPAETETPNWRTTWGHRAAIADRVRIAVRGSVPDRPEFPRYFVLIVRVGPATLDGDNLISACKAARDEIAAWLGLDDADPHIFWSYDQRRELVQNDLPRTRKSQRAYRTWLEFAVSDEPMAEPEPQPPPPRLEREKKRPDVRVDTVRPPVRSIRIGDLAVELAEAPDGSRYVRLCKHFVQQGHAWRTAGAAIPIEARLEVAEALKKIVENILDDHTE